MTSLVPTLVPDLEAKSGNLITLLNNTIKFKLIFKTPESEPYIIRVSDFISWRATGIESFCGPKQVHLCTSDTYPFTCPAPSIDPEIKLDQNPTTLDLFGEMNPIISIDR